MGCVRVCSAVFVKKMNSFFFVWLDATTNNQTQLHVSNKRRMRLSHLFNLGFYAMVDGFFRVNYSRSAASDNNSLMLSEAAPSTTANLLAASVMGGHLVYYGWTHMRKMERDVFVVASAERKSDQNENTKDNWAFHSVKTIARNFSSINVNLQVVAMVAGILSCVCPVEYLRFYLGAENAQRLIAPLQFAVRCQYTVVIFEFWIGLIFS